MVDPRNRVKGYIMKNVLQIVISLLLTVLIMVFTYHFRRLEALEVRVWNLEQGNSSVEILGERTLYLQKQIDQLCTRMEKSTGRLEAMITRLLTLNGLSAEVPETPIIERGG